VIRYDVVGVGNALVDVIGSVEEEFLAAEGIAKGGMRLVDTERAEHLFAQFTRATRTSGGSAANTTYGIASFGGRAAFIGKVANDELGASYAADLARVGVDFHPGATPPTEPTGRCIIAVTPDGERSMSTYLGASAEFAPGDVSTDAIESSAVLFLEGYLFDRDEAKEAYRSASRTARAAGRLVALTLSDSFCVDRHRGDFRSLISEEVGLLFSNEHEVLSLYETSSFDEALERLAVDCDFAVVTRGGDGSEVLRDGERLHVPVVPVRKVVDATGAGDLYAAGFLFGLTHGLALADCGRLGAIAASEVISHVGPRPHVTLSSLIPADLAPAVANTMRP